MNFRLIPLFVLILPLATSAQGTAIQKTGMPGISLKNIDINVDPREDFYGFCNGVWQKTFVMPESDARYGSFNEIHESNLTRLKAIYGELSSSGSAAPNSNSARLRDFYNTAMDSAKADKLGIKPLQPQLAELDKVNTLPEFLKLKARWEHIGVDLLFGSGVSPDLKNSRKNCFNVSQSGYGLGDRDYYHSEAQAAIRKAYLDYVASLLVAGGSQKDSAAKQAQQVFDFEKKLTEKAFTRVEMRDPERMYNVKRRNELKLLCPLINWNEYYGEKHVVAPDTVIVGMVDYMHRVNQLIGETPVSSLKLYARARLLMEAAPYLSSDFVDINFNFRGKVLSGAKQMKPRWQRVHNVVNASMGEIISQEFVKRHFPAEAKEKLNKLIDNLVLAYRERIASRTWMSAETKAQANRKLDLLIRKIGYPEKWKDYSSLKVSTDSYWANVCRANDFLTADNLKDLRKPVDRSKWQMTPITVNAYYDPTTNEITFPAAILQPPFYDPKADDAANYGTMGSIIGHELTHGFDDQGAQFDADGNMKMWWTEKDFQNFKDRTKLIIEQFNRYVAIDTLHVNGSMTQGENIADLGGLTMAYYAYKKSLGGKPSPLIGSFTGEQRFFIAWAQGWKSKTRDAELKRLLTLDYHAPAYFRAFAPLTNMPEFYEAFKVGPGNRMYTDESKRVEIW